MTDMDTETQQGVRGILRVLQPYLIGSALVGGTLGGGQLFDDAESPETLERIRYIEYVHGIEHDEWKYEPKRDRPMNERHRY